MIFTFCLAACQQTLDVNLHKHTHTPTPTHRHSKVTLGLCVTSGVEYLDYSLLLMPLQIESHTERLLTGFSGFVVIFVLAVTCGLTKCGYYQQAERVT